MMFAITGTAIAILILSTSAMAFVKGDKVLLTVNKKLGPVTVESCETKDEQNSCKIKELGYMVNSMYLKKFVASGNRGSATVAKEDEDSSVRLIIGR